MFGGGTRHSARIEKKNQTDNERTKKPDRVSTEAEPERTAQPQRARPGRELTQMQSSRKPARDALPSERCLRNTRCSRDTTTQAANLDALEDDVEDESRNDTLHHTISAGGPRPKNIAELIVEADIHQNFSIPFDNIIVNEGVDSRVRQQMRLIEDGNLTAKRVQAHLVKGVQELEDCWRRRRRQSLQPFWELVCDPGTPRKWVHELPVADCREFFLSLLVYFRNGSGRKASNATIKAFESLDKLFKEEEEKNEHRELEELVNVRPRLQRQVNQSRSRGHAAVSQAAASKKRGGKTVADDGNIFHRSADTNMTDIELSGIDVEELRRIVDVGDKRRMNEEWLRRFYEEIEAHRDSMRQEEEDKRAQEEAAAEEAAAMPTPQPTTQGRKRSSRTRPSPAKVDDLMPQTSLEKPARVGRKFEEEEDEEDEEEAEERKRAAALKRQKLLQKHAARGGPKSD